jgi:hypothetical protein
MLLLPQCKSRAFLCQCNSRAFLCLALCITTICSLQAIALTENQPIGTPGSHAARTQLTSVTTKLQLGDVAVGQSSDKLMTISNRGRTPLIVLSATSTGTEFDLKGLDLPLTLAAGESFTFPVTFSPQRIGPAHGSVSIVSGASEQTLTIQLAGTGRATGQLQVTPAAIDFGDASAGSDGTQKGQLTASGGSVTISAAAISGENFRLGGLSLPITIPEGHSVPFTLKFVPRDSSRASAILSFASDAKNSPTEQALAVPILSPAQHKVQLSWKASTSKHILGYNVYRGNQSGGPYTKINGGLDPNTRFTDLTVIAGKKYYYVATAVNSRKRESRHSKQIKVVIP